MLTRHSYLSGHLASAKPLLAVSGELLLVLPLMTSEIEKRLRAAPVVPLIQATDIDVAVTTARALIEGGLTVIEVVLRTPEALQCLDAIGGEVPDALTGAGTVLNAEQARSAVHSRARFIVSPGLDEGVIDIARKNKLPVYPGVATATELLRAWNMGLRAVKFFPAVEAGGPPMLKSLSAVFRDMVFMPTGGVTASNLGDYLAIPAVIACGGSWLTPKAEIDNGNFKAVTELARQAVSIAAAARG